MIINHIPFETTDWETITPERHEGESGFALWKVKQAGDIRIRLVEYSPGYKADHWCSKGHVIYCIDGSMTTELKDGRKFNLEKGMVYVVGDNIDLHRSFTKNGVKLFIVD